MLLCGTECILYHWDVWNSYSDQHRMGTRETCRNTNQRDSIACISALHTTQPGHASAKKNCVRGEWLRQSERAPSELSEIPRWRITPGPPSIQLVTFHIILGSLFHCFFLLCRSRILNDQSGAVANCDDTSEWVNWVRACIGIAIWWVTLRKSLLAFFLPASKMQFSLY